MTTKLRSQQSHYEVLGLTPSATSEEISAAFARKMSLFRARPLSDLAQVTAAYETLRNPAKRCDYDRSLQPKREPERLEWSFRAVQQSWTPFITSAADEVRGDAEHPLEPHVRPAPDPRPTPQPNPASQPRPAPDPRIESISASLRELAKPAAPMEPSREVAQPDAERPVALAQPRTDRRIERRPEVGLEQLVSQIRTSGRVEKDRLRAGPRLSFDWKQPIWAAGGLIVGVGILGGIAGIAAGGDAHESVTVAVPAAKPVGRAAEPSTELASSLVQVPEQRPRPEVATSRDETSRSFARPAVLDNEPVQVAAQSDPSQGDTETVASDPLAPIPAAAPTATASLPLSNAVIARTIDRIGYACGEVASAAPADGEGVFKITCSSGQVFQAAPVSGRYRFRRWSKR